MKRVSVLQRWGRQPVWNVLPSKSVLMPDLNWSVLKLSSCANNNGKSDADFSLALILEGSYWCQQDSRQRRVTTFLKERLPQRVKYPLVTWKPNLFIFNRISFVTLADYRRQNFLLCLFTPHHKEAVGTNPAISYHCVILFILPELYCARKHCAGTLPSASVATGWAGVRQNGWVARQWTYPWKRETHE